MTKSFRRIILKASAALALCLGGSLGHAQGHTPDENFPQGHLLALEGEDVITKKECFLFVMDVDGRGAELVAEVLTGYTHNDETADRIEVRVAPGRPDTLVGMGANGKDQIAISLAGPGQDLQSATAFNAKWWHTNHYHNSRCVNLKVHNHAQDL